MNTETNTESQKFGTFIGVYVPSVLTILGLIMYLRFGWVVGNVGLPLTIFIVLLASSITFITALSASSIATNMRIGVGGEYYMISRSLGIELGGAIGIPLFLCRTLSITFYCFGLSEVIITFWEMYNGALPGYSVQLLAAIIIIFTIFLSGKSAGLVLRLQVPILVAVILSVLALIIGVFQGELRSPEMMTTYRTTEKGFWYVFAVFFPAVTGFAAGIGLSGDLKDPKRSIPLGSILSVVTGAVVYILIPILLSISGKISFDKLAVPSIESWTDIAIFGNFFIVPGIVGALLSSAFGSALGGPRVLQALASDGLAPKIFAKLTPSGQPAIATYVSGFIALIAVAMGELNTIAQFVSILFLTLYVIMNLSAAIEKLVKDPSFRPTINVPWYVSILGAVGGIWIMFLISPISCIIAVILEFLLYMYLRRRSLQKRWGDVWAGLWVALARFSLIKLNTHKVEPRNWRPHILVFAGEESKRTSLIRLANWFNQNRGIVTVSKIIVSNLKDDEFDIPKLVEKMKSTFKEQNLDVFSEVNVVNDFEEGSITIAQANGIAGLHSNTVMLGWSDKHDRRVSQLRIMRAVSKAGKSSVISRINWAHEPGQQKRIDVWWRGKQHNGDLMLLLSYLLKLNYQWNDAKITIRTIISEEDNLANESRNISDIALFLPETRIDAEIDTIVKPKDKTIMEVMHETSRNSDIVFLGLNLPKVGEEDAYAKSLEDLSNGFKTTIFVRNGSDFSGQLL